MAEDCVCKNCGSDDIASVEEAETWATIEVHKNDIGGLYADWPSGIPTDVDWETTGYVCRACFTKAPTLEELVRIADLREIDPEGFANLLGNIA